MLRTSPVRHAVVAAAAGAGHELGQAGQVAVLRGVVHVVRRGQAAAVPVRLRQVLNLQPSVLSLRQVLNLQPSVLRLRQVLNLQPSVLSQIQAVQGPSTQCAQSQTGCPVSINPVCSVRNRLSTVWCPVSGVQCLVFSLYLSLVCQNRVFSVWCSVSI